jgi:hypothetical protein
VATVRAVGSGSARLNRPAVPALALLLVGLVFVALRIAAAGSGHIGSFVYAGSEFSRPPIPGVPVMAGAGYDGQFAYRLAVDPADLHPVAAGIRLDTTLRLERISYPALAWVASAGHRSAVPYSLVAVNLLALGALGWLGGLLARAAGRHAAWGLLLAGYWGYLFSLGRDLHEIVTGAFVLAGLLAYRSRRPATTAVLFSLAVLTRETALLVVVAIAAVRLADILRRRERPAALEAAWAVPVVVFVGWQVVCRAVAGAVPTLAAGPAQVGPPVLSFAEAVLDSVRGLGGNHRAASLLLVVQLVALLVVVALAATRLRDATILREERLAWVLALVLTLSLSRHFWSGPADLRALSDIYLLSAVLLLSSPPAAARIRLPDRRLLLLAAAPAAATFAITFVARVVAL